MGGGGGLGGAVSGVFGGGGLMGGLGGGFSALGGELGGSGQNSGILGTGQFRTDPYSVNASSFAANPAEQQYTQQLQNLAYGQGGPSPAQLQMQQGLQQATQQAQAIGASQRGVSPALAARMTAQSQAGLSQNVAQNAGIQRAQEQLNNMGMLGQELQSQRAGQEGLQNLQSGNYNFAQGANEQGYASAAGQRSNLMGGIMNGAGAMLGMADGGQVDPDPGSMNNTPQVPQLPAPQKSGGGGGGIMSMLPMLAMAAARGGQVPGCYAGGGSVQMDPITDPSSFNKTPQVPTLAAPGPNPYTKQNGQGKSASSSIGKYLNGQMNQSSPSTPNTGNAITGGPGNYLSAAPYAKGGSVQMLDKGGSAVPMAMSGMNSNTFYAPMKTGQMARSQGPQQAPIDLLGQYQPQPQRQSGPGYQVFAKSGGKVPGEAKVKGDSLKNDKVPAMLSPKEIVLPRSVTMDPDAPNKAREFVAAIMAKNGKMPNRKKSA